MTATTMIDLARRWCSLLGINPDTDPQPPTPDPGLFAGALAAAITDYQAAAHTSSVADYRAATIATTHRAPATWTRRDPTDTERRAARHLAARLATAHTTPEPATRPTTTPPGRLRTRHALTAQAQIDAGSIPTATPWQRRTHQPPPRPRLHLAVLVDVSGSMADYTKPMSSAAWILAHAAGHTHATTTTIAFGPTVTLLTPPNSRPDHVLDINVAGGTDTFTQAIKLADELLHLRRPDTTRLLCVVSDGYLADRDAAQKLLSTLHHTGCRTLWLEPAGHSAPPFADTTTLVRRRPGRCHHGHRRRRLRGTRRPSTSAAARLDHRRSGRRRLRVTAQAGATRRRGLLVPGARTADFACDALPLRPIGASDESAEALRQLRPDPCGRAVWRG